MEEVLYQIRILQNALELLQNFFKKNPELEEIEVFFESFVDDSQLLFEIFTVNINGVYNNPHEDFWSEDCLITLDQWEDDLVDIFHSFFYETDEEQILRFKREILLNYKP